jgi:hypothetical protein
MAGAALFALVILEFSAGCGQPQYGGECLFLTTHNTAQQ